MCIDQTKKETFNSARISYLTLNEFFFIVPLGAAVDLLIRLSLLDASRKIKITKTRVEAYSFTKKEPFYS